MTTTPLCFARMSTPRVPVIRVEAPFRSTVTVEPMATLAFANAVVTPKKIGL